MTIEDIRLLVSQAVGLNYLVPLAIEILTENIWAEGDYYEGDLLQSVLNVKNGFWADNLQAWISVNELIKRNQFELKSKRIDTSIFENKL